MATYTFELSNDLTLQEIDDYAKSHNVDIGKLLSDTISGMLKSKKPVIDDETQLQLNKVRAFRKKYAHLKHKEPLSIEEMDKIAREAFVKKWEENERLNKSDDQ